MDTPRDHSPSVALSGSRLDSVKHTLRGEPYIFVGLETRYQLNAFNRKGIDDRWMCR